MGSATGTIRKAVIDGVTYDVFADANITFNASKFETEGVATSGKTKFKMTRKVRTMESLGLATTPGEMENLKTKAESLADITMSVELADGSVYKAAGRINFDNFESETGKTTVKLIPADEWTPFLAD